LSTLVTVDKATAMLLLLTAMMRTLPQSTDKEITVSFMAESSIV